MAALELKKKGFKRVFIIKHGMIEMRKVGFIWDRGGDLFQAGPDGKVKRIN